MEPIGYSPELKAGLPQLIASVQSAGLEGLVAKRRNSRYEPGQRSGAWRKMRINRGHEFVIGGYTPSGRNFDALIFGYYKDGNLQYAARTRNGFTPSSREQLFKKLQPLETKECPFVNLTRGEKWPVGYRADGAENEGHQPSAFAFWKKWSTIQSISRGQSSEALLESCSRVDVGIQEPWASTFNLGRNLREQSRSAIECRPSPVRKGFPIDITRNSFGEAVGMHQLR